MADVSFDQEAVELAKKLHRNFLKANQHVEAAIKAGWKDFYEQAARFLGRWHEPS
ncbi:hypothetical protein [Bradyrhizobium sp. th.b2]|uniref:hypothetical protein n=1 Tax=Bradyrhizobium sp. th-b2 TaxID=172088 RepID=UPI000408A5E7|nr:hypothetical protein [Bradyrhizobium sp. th.b2]